MEKIKFPSIWIAHTPNGPTNCCEDHAKKVVSLFNFMGVHVHLEPLSLFDGGRECDNCLHEAKKGESAMRTDYLKEIEMKTHELKALPEYFDAQLNGLKKFEVRKNDRDFQCFDTIILREWDGGKYTGRKLKKRITYVLGDNFEGIEHGFVVLGTSDFLGA